MPRTLARLRYRQPPIPIKFARIDTSRPNFGQRLEKRVTHYVVRESNPRHVKLQTVVNPKAKLRSPGKSVARPFKPFSLRDVVDPEEKARHGEIIYVFRNSKTNQIIYSLQELLDQHHLEQLPFIGKHSTPPVLRPDEWLPHCVVTFPTPEQGHNAFRKLREFRTLHELAWEKTNPEWKNLSRKARIKKIMDQRANMSADLAEVLRLQAEHGNSMAKAIEEHEQQAIEHMDERWAEIDRLVKAALAKEKEADNPKWLQHQVRSMNIRLMMKHNQNEADQKRLKSAKKSLELRLKRVQTALRKAEQLKDYQEPVQQTAAPANVLGAEARLESLKSKASTLQAALQNPDPERSKEELRHDQTLLAQHQRDIAILEAAFVAKAQLDRRDSHIERSVLPRKLQQALPKPFTLERVSVQWADIQDALHASGQWPELIEHETLALSKAREEVQLMRREDYDFYVDTEVGQVIEALQRRDAERAMESEVAKQGNGPKVQRLHVEEEKTGLSKWIPQIKNPFKSATA